MTRIERSLCLAVGLVGVVTFTLALVLPRSAGGLNGTLGIIGAVVALAALVAGFMLRSRARHSS